MTPPREPLLHLTRRHFFQQSGFGIGSLALASLLDRSLLAQTGTLQGTHFAPKAKNIIFLFMAGAPSQLDLFDYKPTLTRLDGQPCPEDVIKGERFAFIKGVPKLLGSPHTFAKYGTGIRARSFRACCRIWRRSSDDIAFVRSMPHHAVQPRARRRFS